MFYRQRANNNVGGRYCFFFFYYPDILVMFDIENCVIIKLPTRIYNYYEYYFEYHTVKRIRLEFDKLTKVSSNVFNVC